MALLVSVQMAAALALKQWLATSMPDVVVEERWPSPNKALPAKAITIVLAGPRQDIMTDPVVVGQANINATNANYTYRVRSSRQPLQLDVWAAYDPVRDDMVARLDTFLNAGPAQTIPGTYNGEPFRNGVLLVLANGWSGFVDCWFDAPESVDTPDAAQQSEYRSSYRGMAVLDVTVTAASPRLAQLIFKQKDHESALPAPSSMLYDIATITTAGVTRSQGP